MLHRPAGEIRRDMREIWRDMGERRDMGETWGRYGEICGRYDLHDDVRRRDEPPRQRLHLGWPPKEEKRPSLVAEEGEDGNGARA